MRWLVADTNLESRGAPVNKLDGALGLHGSNCAVDFLWHNVATVQEAGRHVFTLARITLDHLVARLETRGGNFMDRIGFIA